MGHALGVHLDAEVTTRDDDAVAGIDDRGDVVDGAFVLDLGDEPDAGAAVSVEKRAHDGEVRGVSHGGDSHEVDALLDAEQKVALIVL